MKQMTRFLIEEQRRHKDATGNFTALVNDVRLARKRIATLTGKGALADPRGDTANEIFVRTNEWGGQLAGMVSQEMEAPYVIPADYPRGRYLLLFDPVDGSPNAHVKVPVGGPSWAA